MNSNPNYARNKLSQKKLESIDGEASEIVNGKQEM